MIEIINAAVHAINCLPNIYFTVLLSTMGQMQIKYFLHHKWNNLFIKMLL